MYEFADKTIKYLNKRYIEIFRKLKRNVRSLAKLDEVTTLGYVTETYKQLNEITTPMLIQIAKRAYKDANPDGTLFDMWILGYLDAFNPTSTYIYTKEAETADRYIEKVTPCLTALYVASLKYPPSVCFLCAFPDTRVIFTSVSGEPVKTPM